MFLLSYKNSTEYIRIDNIGKSTEAHTKLNLWSPNDLKQNSGSASDPKKATQTEKTKVSFVCPVYDRFLQAFIVTKNTETESISFYMDLNGFYDQNFDKISWSHYVYKV